jgi:hypothetical protein
LRSIAAPRKLNWPDRLERYMGVPEFDDTLEFEGFRLDRRAGTLSRQDESGQASPLVIGSRAFQILQLLVDHQGDLVPKQTIMDRVWPDTVVEESNLTTQISACDVCSTAIAAAKAVSRRSLAEVIALSRVCAELVGSSYRTTPRRRSGGTLGRQDHRKSPPSPQHRGVHEIQRRCIGGSHPSSS